MNYTKEDLDRLHIELIDILEEFIRICDILNISYFIQGGTAIGSLFNQGIIPWDDDIDVGLTRNDYNRFLMEGPKVIKPEYYIQSIHSEPKVPYYFIKIRKKGTTFIEEWNKHIPMKDCGIFVDVFPFDKVPKSNFKEKIHRLIAHSLSVIFHNRQLGLMHAKYIFRKLPKPIMLLTSQAFTFCVSRFSAKKIHALLTKVQTWYNKCDADFVNIVVMPRDHIPVKDIDNTQDMPFDRLIVKAPNHLEEYLKHHYPRLRPTLPKEEQINHRPWKLVFTE